MIDFDFENGIIRYLRSPGDVDGVAELPDGGRLIVPGAISVGDPVFLPAEIGGGMRRVAEVFHGACPLCVQDWRESLVRHYVMTGGDFACAECKTHKFVWYGSRP